MKNVIGLDQSSQIISLLQNDAVILAPSDTVLGLLGACSQQVVEGFDRIKNRKGKPYVVLVSSLEQAEQIVQVPQECKRALKSIWPGSLTCIFKAQEHLPSFMMSQERTVAVRVPNQKQLQQVLKSVGPMFSTSANVSGESIPESLEDVSQSILHNVDAVWIDENRRYPQIPSTIIDCTGQEIQLIREGVISWFTLQEYFKLS